MRRATRRLVSAVALATAAAAVVPSSAASAAPKVTTADRPFVIIEAGEEPDVGVPADWEDPAAAGTRGEDLPDEQSPAHAAGDPDCKGQWIYHKKKRFDDRMGRVGPNISHFFNSAGSHKLTSGISGELSIGHSIGVSGEGSVIVATLQAKLDHTIQATIGVSASTEASTNVPAKRWGNAFWGRARLVVTGEKYQLAARTCKKINRKLLTTYVSARSRAIGWCIWSSKKSLGSRPPQCNDGKPYLKV
ncbi:hypothetical protein GCM10010123_35010 [Pilimelia anulata]|uniref:Secreted protein n=1 Tax=Pilimelia anulata TaxID=53371 RepID=A0A8J3FCX3_9ACTN|nr:hypothetical protein [Pilimelia anulata]GGK02033.1 hypothetical protein GCM10010123_35010 [Pilimelia anulata]